MCRTGSRLMVMKPRAWALSSTTLIMGGLGGRMHLEYPIAAPRSDPFDLVPKAREPYGQWVAPERALNHEDGGAAGFEPANPVEQELVKSGLAQTHRGIGIHAYETHVLGDGIGMYGHDVGRAGTLGVARAELECAPVHVDRPYASIGLAQGQRDSDRSIAAHDIDEVGGTRG